MVLEGGGHQCLRANSKEREHSGEGGNLVPAVSHHPPCTLFIVHKWAGINSFNLELNVLTLVLPPPPHPPPPPPPHLTSDVPAGFFL